MKKWGGSTVCTKRKLWSKKHTAMVSSNKPAEEYWLLGQAQEEENRRAPHRTSLVVIVGTRSSEYLSFTNRRSNWQEFRGGVVFKKGKKTGLESNKKDYQYPPMTVL